MVNYTTMVRNGKTAMDVDIVLPKNVPVHFHIINEGQFQDLFTSNGVDISREGFSYDEAGTRVCTEIAQEVKEWIKKGTCPHIFFPAYKDDGMVEFRFVQMTEDEYSNVYLEYEFITTMS